MFLINIICDSGLGVEMVDPCILPLTPFLGRGEGGENEELESGIDDGRCCIGDVLAVNDFEVVAVFVD